MPNEQPKVTELVAPEQRSVSKASWSNLVNPMTEINELIGGCVVMPPQLENPPRLGFLVFSVQRFRSYQSPNSSNQDLDIESCTL